MKNDYHSKEISYYQNIPFYLEPFIPGKIQIVLDVGCSSGQIKFLLKDKMRLNCEIWGVEPELRSVEIAKQNLDTVFHGFFNHEIDFGGQKFDCIFFNDVLEHMYDPAEALTTAKKLLNEGGEIVASIPQVRFYKIIKQLLLQKDWRYEESGVMDATHIRFFTKKSIIRMFKECGYEVETIKPICNVLPFNQKLKYLYRIFEFIIGDIFYTNYAVVAKPRLT